MIYVRVAPVIGAPATGKIDAVELRSSLKRCIPVALPRVRGDGRSLFWHLYRHGSAAVGAIGAFVCAVCRGKLNRGSFLEVMGETTATTAMVYGLIIGAQIFSFFVSVSALTEAATAFVGPCIGRRSR